LAHGTGAEVQKPLAMVVIGGLVTATAVTLLVLPPIAKLLLSIGERRGAATTDLPAHPVEASA